MEDFKIKSTECIAYLFVREHSAKLVKSQYDRVYSTPGHEAHKKIEKSLKNKVTFSQLSIHKVSTCLRLSISTFI